LRVLLVDDSDASELIVRALLPEGRYQVDRVAEMNAARAAIARGEHDVALVDYKLPGYSGVDLIRDAVRAGCRMPLVLLTGFGEAAIDLEAMEAGASDYLDKGKLDAELLERTLRYAVERQRAGYVLSRLQKAVETMQIGVTVTDLSGRIVYVNPAEATLHGYTVEELRGRESRQLSPREDWRPLGLEDLRRLKRWRRERMRIRKDGSRFPVQLLSDVVFDGQGHPIGIVTTCEDITERRRAEDALRASETRFRSLVESARDVIFSLSLDGRFTSLNPAFELVTGWPGEQWIGKRIEGLLHPDDVAAVRRGLSRLAAGETPALTERRIFTARGDWLTVEVTSTPLRDNEGVLGVLGIARDVTPRKRAEQRQDLQLAVTRVLAEGVSLTDAGPHLLRAMGERLGFEVGLLWVADAERRRLRCVCVWAEPGVPTPSLGGSIRDAPEGTPGPSPLANRVWADRQPAWVRDVAGEEAAPAYAALADGLHGAFAIPIISGAEAIGVLEFYARKPRFSDDADLVTAQDIGRQVGLFVQRGLAQIAQRKSEQRFRSVAQSAQDAIVFADPRGAIVFWNRSAEGMFEWQSAAVLGRPLSSLVAPSHRSDLDAALEGLRAGIPAPLLGAFEDFRALRRDGTEFPVELSLSSWGEGGEVSFAAIVRDITDRRAAEAALRESAERYELAVRGTNDGIWDWDLVADRLYLSPRWKQIVGYEEDELGDLPHEWLDRIHPDDSPRVLRKIAAHVAGETPLFEDEHRVRHQDGSYRWVLCRGFAARDAGGEPHRMAGAQTDVTDRRAYDPLTGLPNRALFTERVGQAMQRSRNQADGLFAVLFLDLDGFKDVNDTLGHLAGDQLLMSIARRLEASVRPGDVVARFGGDEFAVLLQRVGGTADATRVAERILRHLAEPTDVSDQSVSARGSIGIAYNRPETARVDELLREADAAMYRAKSLGKGRYEVFDETMRARENSRLLMQRDLRDALDDHMLRLAWQPVRHVQDGRTAGFEALLRWSRHGTLLEPHEFLEVAEESGALASWRSWILGEACARAAAWPGDTWVAVNLSTRQLREPDLLEDVSHALVTSGLSPGRLCLEATEAALHQAREARPDLDALRARGVRVMVDDFGRDEASLRGLLELPVDGLKLEVGRSGQPDGRLLQGALALARALGLEVIGESVEDEEQRARLVELGVRLAQGRHLGGPLGEEQLPGWLG
jgi:diguanylate cyclase (GGDEF)-like protein/PAS domain S-box-containing protein